MVQKHGMALFRRLATDMQTAVDNHDQPALEQLANEFIAEIAHKSQMYAKCGTGTSDAKRATAVANGARGGRPKSRKTK